MTSLIRTLLLLVLLSIAAPIAPTLAQDQRDLAGVEDAAPAVIPGLAVAENKATAEFPEGITFSLNAETEDPIANVELMYRPSGVETYSVELPPFEPGTTELDIDQSIDSGPGGTSQLPVGIDVQYHWRITEEDGDVVETPDQIRFWVDDRFEWVPLVGPNVTVYTYDADPVFQQNILDVAERTVASLSKAYEIELEHRLRIWVYSNKDDFNGIQAPFEALWAAGGNYGSLHLTHAILPPDRPSEVTRIVPHELTHQVLHQATENPYNEPPGWIEEGLATYWQESGRDRFYSYALEQAATGDVPSLRTINVPSPYFPYDGEAALSAYAFSLSAVMYVIDTWGDAGMSKILATFREGVTYDDAIEQGLGITFDELDRRWREDLIADAQQAGAAGTTRFGDDGGRSPWATIGDGLALASGTVVLGLVVLVALVAGLFSFVRSRRRFHDDEPTDEGVRWGEWPEGLELPRVLRES
jgi:hypothetical protein